MSVYSLTADLSGTRDQIKANSTVIFNREWDELEIVVSQSVEDDPETGVRRQSYRFTANLICLSRKSIMLEGPEEATYVEAISELLALTATMVGKVLEKDFKIMEA